jgi:DNA-binding SARP family transcriptional activator
MERALLHLLSIKAGSSVHREALIEALWPEADRDAGLHRLQVAVSSLRRLLSGGGMDGTQFLARHGDSYRLALPEGSVADILDLERAMQRSIVARAAGDSEAEQAALVAVMDSYAGPLLPADGPAEWVVGPRAEYQSMYTEAASRLAALHLQADDPQAAAEAARAGLAVDRYRDELWKLRIEASERAGNHAEAGQARRAYEAVLEEMGV